MRKPRFGISKQLKFDSGITKIMIWEQTLNCFRVLDLKVIFTSPEIISRSGKLCKLLSGVHHAAPTIFQGGSEVPQRLPGCARGARIARMASQNIKMESPSLRNCNPMKQKGLAVEGVALKIIIIAIIIIICGALPGRKAVIQNATHFHCL